LLVTVADRARQLGYEPIVFGAEIQSEVVVMANATMTLSGLDGVIATASSLH